MVGFQQSRQSNCSHRNNFEKLHLKLRKNCNFSVLWHIVFGILYVRWMICWRSFIAINFKYIVKTFLKAITYNARKKIEVFLFHKIKNSGWLFRLLLPILCVMQKFVVRPQTYYTHYSILKEYWKNVAETWLQGWMLKCECFFNAECRIEYVDFSCWAIAMLNVEM